LAVEAFKADSSSMLTTACGHSPEDVLKEAGRILARQDATEKRRFVEAVIWLAETVAEIRPRRAGPSEAAIAQVRSWLEGPS
jgi:4-aminobutyrate aminotransferase-like enzyme